jgi:hypothetical protein
MEAVMLEEKLFRVEEAKGLLTVVKTYLLRVEGDLPADERKGLGRLLDEIQVSLDSTPAPLPDNVKPWPTLRP